MMIRSMNMFLELHDIRKSYGEGRNRIDVLKGIDLSIERGEICVLLGPSGSGKSTLLNIIGGIDTALDGELIIDERHMENLGEKELEKYRRKNLGYVFQSYNLINNLTVKENIETGAYLSDNSLDIDLIINKLGLKDQMNKLPNQLSGGQQQRTSIGRAIVKNPKILLCDEPTGALDYRTSKEILKLISDINKEYETTVIIVTHNNAISNMGDHVVRLHDGGISMDKINEKKIDAMELEW